MCFNIEFIGGLLTLLVFLSIFGVFVSILAYFIMYVVIPALVIVGIVALVKKIRRSNA